MANYACIYVCSSSSKFFFSFERPVDATVFLVNVKFSMTQVENHVDLEKFCGLCPVRKRLRLKRCRSLDFSVDSLEHHHMNISCGMCSIERSVVQLKTHVIRVSIIELRIKEVDNR